MFRGGIADKLGNRYEAKWLVTQLLGVLRGEARSLRFEGITSDFDGFEFVVRLVNFDEWHQCKASSPGGNWTVRSLETAGVLSAFKTRLGKDEQSRCIFVSEDSAKVLRTTCEKAKIANSQDEFSETLANDQIDAFNDLQHFWKVDAEIAFKWLRRLSFQTETVRSVEKIIGVYSDALFENGENAFAELRDFLELRFNKEISEDSAREEIRKERKLRLKDWSEYELLAARLKSETTQYLATYNPFGVGGGDTIQRPQAQEMLDLVANNDGPQVILLTGVAGSGKSGVIRQFIHGLQSRSIDHLAIRIDQNLDCKNSRDLGKAVTDRAESPVTTLNAVANTKLSILIVDQVDAVSDVSGRNGAVKRAVLELVDEVRTLRPVKLVIVCRSFDLESDDRLRDLKTANKVQHIQVPILDWTKDVQPFLERRGIKPSLLTEQEKGLLELPINLVLFVEVYDPSRSSIGSRNDLFRRLIEKKETLVKQNATVSWDVLAPLNRIAEWMNEHQSLDAPENVLFEFPNSRIVLQSEGLIACSRSRVNFFHESFFDYLYARMFSSQQKTLLELVRQSEQHLFRRTQIRQILEAYRQIDEDRYISELSSLIESENVRFHIKLAAMQWLGSQPNPTDREVKIALALDRQNERLPLLAASVLLGSAGWFRKLSSIAWLDDALNSVIEERAHFAHFRLAELAGRIPDEVAAFLENWMQGDEARAESLLGWFGYVRRSSPDAALLRLCVKTMRQHPRAVFAKGTKHRRDLLLHTWAEADRDGVAQILSAYFDAWFVANPDESPFEHENFQRLDKYSLSEIVKRRPYDFLKGTTSALNEAVSLAIAREGDGKYHGDFKRRAYEGYHHAEDSFLSMYRTALVYAAGDDPSEALNILVLLDFSKHEVFAHLWLEAIAACPHSLGKYLLLLVVGSPYTFEAGFEGVDWHSFARAFSVAAQFLPGGARRAIERCILTHAPELASVIEFKTSERRHLSYLLSGAGTRQLCILECVGNANLMTAEAKARLAQLHRKFPKFVLPRPSVNEARWVESPIDQRRVARMSKKQWLRAIEKYNSDDRALRREFFTGGARQLSQLLHSEVKNHPSKFLELLLEIPNEAPTSYVSSILSGLCEVKNLSPKIAKRAVINAFSRREHQYESEIIRLIESKPDIVDDEEVFSILVGFVRSGSLGTGSGDTQEKASADSISSIEELLDAHRVIVRSGEGGRARAVEALESVVWSDGRRTSECWQILDERIPIERDINTRCAFMEPLLPLYNDDRLRCARTVSQIVARTVPLWVRLMERFWIYLNLRSYVSAPGLRLLIWVLDWLLPRAAISKHFDTVPLCTHGGVRLLIYVLRNVAEEGDKILFRHLASSREITRQLGAWHVFRLSFVFEKYSLLADMLAQKSAVFRRLAASVAAGAVSNDELRLRAEHQLATFFNDPDEAVRKQAADAFRLMSDADFEISKDLVAKFIESDAFEESNFVLHKLEDAHFSVVELAIRATERVVEDISLSGNIAGRRSMDLHYLQRIIRREYANSELYPALRTRLLDVIDLLLETRTIGAEEILDQYGR